jgi:uncharacterized membrane protein YgcG
VRLDPPIHERETCRLLTLEREDCPLEPDGPDEPDEPAEPEELEEPDELPTEVDPSDPVAAPAEEALIGGVFTPDAETAGTLVSTGAAGAGAGSSGTAGSGTSTGGREGGGGTGGSGTGNGAAAAWPAISATPRIPTTKTPPLTSLTTRIELN